MATWKHIEMGTYMHKETFDIYIVTGDSHPDYTDGDYFQIDELIALPVQVLNRKGYRTEMCCSGHLTGSHTIAKGLFKLDGDTSRGGRSSIRFKKGISLPSLPPGFMDSNHDNSLIISHSYNTNDIYGLLHENLKTMERLYKWALELPDFNDIEKDIE